jgi:hypothetical protein
MCRSGIASEVNSCVLTRADRHWRL